MAGAKAPAIFIHLGQVKEFAVIAWGFVFLVASLCAALLGFCGLIVAHQAAVFRFLFFVNLVLFLGSTIYGLSHPA